MILLNVATTEHQKLVRSLQDPPWEALPPGTAAALRPGLATTADEMIDAIREAVPAYARPLEGRFGSGIRTGVIRALEQFVSAVEGNRLRPGQGRDIYFELGRGEAREGRALEALLSAYRVGARVAWRHASTAAGEAGLGADTLGPLAESVFAFIDELSGRSAEGYAYEQSLAAGEAASRRRALLQLMVARPPAEPAAVEDAAREAGWPLPESLAALVWADDPELRRASRLPLGSLAARVRDDVACALVPDALAPGRLAELERLFQGGGAALGPLVPWPESWRSAARAGTALRLAADGLLPRERLVVTGRHLAALAVHRDRRLLEDLAASRLAPLSRRTPGARARLLETLRAWLDHQGRVPDVAQALHVHPQTVRYRLAQLREAFGEDLDDPDSRFELALAVREPQATSRSLPVSTS